MASPAQAAPTSDVAGGGALPATDAPALVDGLSDAVDADVAPAAAARAHLKGHQDRYHIPSPDQDLVVAAVSTDADGLETVRLDQKYRGVPVLGAQYVVRMTHKDGKRTVTGASGSYFTGLDVDTERKAAPVDTSVDAAVQYVSGQLARGGYLPTRSASGSATLKGVDRGLMILPRGKGVLARQVTVSGSDPLTGEPVVQEVYVDAKTGLALFESGGLPTFATPGQNARSRQSGPPKQDEADPVAAKSAPEGPVSSGVTGSGTLFNGTTVPLNLTKDDATGTYLLRDTTRVTDAKGTKDTTQNNVLQTWDAEGTWYQEVSGGKWPATIVPITSPTQQLGSDLTESGAVDAHWAAGEVYDYYRDVFQRESLDDEGMPINSVIGVTEYGGPWVNAFWDHTKMVYGAGDQEHRSLASDLDVVGHEMTHGVVEHTANLAYVGQSGAMNEAVADYFGNVIDITVGGTSMSDPDAGLIGGDLCRTVTPRQCAFRDLNDGATTDTFLGLPLGTTTDNGGVHVNSTIFSGALWDIRESLGGELSDTIVYRALNSYLTPLDDFEDGREAVVAAARTLGVKGDRLDAVTKAFDDHGIVPGWEQKLGLDRDVLLSDLGTLQQWVGSGNAPSAEGGWYAVPRSSPDSAAPYAVWAGRTDGTGRPHRVSPDDGRNHLSPVTDGKRVVWVAVGDVPDDPWSHTYEILSAPVQGGKASTLFTAPAAISGLSVDGDTVAWSYRDPETGKVRSHYLKGDDTTPRQVPLSAEYNQADHPVVKNGRITYVHNGMFGDRYGARVETYDIATGTTTALGAIEQPEWMSGLVATESDVYWLIDTDPMDEDQTTLRRAHFDGSAAPVVTDVFAEHTDRAVPAFGLAATDSAITLTVYPSYGQIFEDRNDSLAKLYQYTLDGTPLGRVSCGVGQQSNAAADNGDQVLWMDTSTGTTHLVVRDHPAGTCD
jgi:Zn-dependent metalloprotease